MKSMHKDHAALLSRLASGASARYERRNAEVTDAAKLGQTLDGIADAFDAFKVKAQGEADELRATVDRLETKLSRPGALNAANKPADDDRVKLFNEKTGKPVLVLKAGDNIHGRYRDAGRADADQEGEATMSDFFRGVAGMKTRSELVRKSLAAGTDTAGGFTLPNVVFRDVLTGLVAESTLLQAGAVVVPMGSEGDGAKNYSYAAINALPTADWRAELGSVALSEPTFRQVLITPRSLALYFKVSRELLMDSQNIDTTLTMAITQAFAKELDRVGLLGTGTAPQPRGLLNVAGVLAVTNGANGASLATLRYANLFSGALAVLNADAPMPTATIMAHRSRIGLGQLADTTNQPLEVPSMLRPISLLSTSQIPVNLTVGTSTDCSTMFMGKFGWMGFALRENVNVQVMRETFATTGEVGFFAHARVDVMCFYPQAFAVITGIRP
jgi:HK97 family phage major capsid protein